MVDSRFGILDIVSLECLVDPASSDQLVAGLVDAWMDARARELASDHEAVAGLDPSWTRWFAFCDAFPRVDDRRGVGEMLDEQYRP